MAWHEWPLIVFTVLAQTSVGAFLVLATMMLTKQLSLAAEKRLHQAMFCLWAIMGMGFLASIMHLGSPLRAMNALNMLGSSWLSNEIATGSAFFALGGMFWLLSVLKFGSVAIRKAFMVGAMLVGVAFMYAMTMVYMIDTVPTWYTPLTPAAFMITMLISGTALAQLLLSVAKHDSTVANKLLPIMGLVGMFAVVMVVMLLSSHLASIETSVTTALAVVPEHTSLQLTRIVLTVAAMVLWLLPVVQRKKVTVLPMAMAFTMIVVAELIGRGMFYGMHLSAGM
ncbi:MULTISPECIES: DmsC/YnfH family molybdoenzyme membrane anchor subunit [unclassified Photobacterium]|uniref:DmsC/YnfH family molybdoenzyme membrane anchor subunit n=1 Tax=unclassified Photobacterium TaxID=2628852 RepID=UPI001EDEF608|nr:MULTISPECIES: DmsC/YnfH family molybdoenzyme membrane anchor subunit [unclassified Photobacterium]MCG3863560.1 dimethyl sulfoxide reductase anchor subunit [Photobacterium sp. Ph6]MCG3875089.1 dimethyl sulfoxide reductase anchor subunit [Photobacterium sp. Ph5]